MAKHTVNGSQMPDWIPRFVVTIFVAVLAVVFTLFLVSKLQGLISLILISLFLSFALEPFVNYLVTRGVKRGLATGLILFGFAVGILVLIGAMVPLILQQINEVVRQAPAWLTSASDQIERWFGITVSQEELVGQLKSADGLLASYVSDFAGNIFGISKQVLLSLLQVFGVLLFTFYFVADAPHLRRIICSFLPPKSQLLVLNTWEVAISKTGGFMVSRAILGFISAAATCTVLTLLGVPLPYHLRSGWGLYLNSCRLSVLFWRRAYPLLLHLSLNLKHLYRCLYLFSCINRLKITFLPPYYSAHHGVAPGCCVWGGCRRRKHRRGGRGASRTSNCRNIARERQGLFSAA